MSQQKYQEALLAEFEKVAESLGSTTLVHMDYANTGAVIAGTPFKQDASLRFDVQRDTVKILFNGASLGDSEDSFYFKITETEKAQQMLDRWRELIAAARA